MRNAIRNISNAALTGRQNGISMIVVLILTVVIGLTAAAAMRGATSSQRLTNNVRMENMAQQYAEAALRFCETQVQIPFNAVGPAPVRTPNLAAANIPVRIVPAMQGQWENSATWTAAAGTGAAIARVDLQAGQYSSALSSSLPAAAPQCAAEMQVLTNGTATFTVTVVTSRGFSSDYTADAGGNTTRGSVVWLQSTLNVCPGNQAAVTLNPADPC